MISGHFSPGAVALGTFDGMHPGHLAVIDRTVTEARARGLAARVFTFYENPRSVFSAAPLSLMTAEEKEAAMRARGIDEVIFVHFTPEFAAVPPEDFLRMLVSEYGARVLVAGEDYTFGSRAAGNTNLLRKMSAALGYEAIVVPLVTVSEGGRRVKISSSAIREAIQENREDLVRMYMTGDENHEESNSNEHEESNSNE